MLVKWFLASLVSLLVRKHKKKNLYYSNTNSNIYINYFYYFLKKMLNMFLFLSTLSIQNQLIGHWLKLQDFQLKIISFFFLSFFKHIFFLKIYQAVYLTAYYAIYRCTHLEKGDSALVHSAAGGVGMKTKETNVF